MSNISTQLDPTLRSVESLEFEFALRNKIVGQEEAARVPMRGIEVLSNEYK